MQQFFIPLLIVLVAIPLFLQARKQKKTMQEQQKLQKAVGVGDRIMTTSGLYGTVIETSEDTIDLEIAPGMTTTWLRQAVREKVETETDSAEEIEETDTSHDADGSAAAEASGEKQSGASSESGAQFAEPIEKQKTN